MTEITKSTEMLDGAKEIAEFLGLRERSIYHLVAKGQLPVIRLGGKIAARRSTLERWLNDKEADALAAGASSKS